ncbi:unnamed protein product [Blepharisma stoltei]|uniref:UBA domain-containing protein n=1 Tax=Blepharisma stoltei TaxID=1481888 RepID=A0AAU9J432_9CILI|nr:unnamed protein product [Blepharisma stoltei]
MGEIHEIEGFEIDAEILQDLGYGEAEAREALAICEGDLEHAVALLTPGILTGEDELGDEEMLGEEIDEGGVKEYENYKEERAWEESIRVMIAQRNGEVLDHGELMMAAGLYSLELRLKKEYEIKKEEDEGMEEKTEEVKSNKNAAKSKRARNARKVKKGQMS